MKSTCVHCKRRFNGFTRVNKVSSERVDTFVKAISGKRLGTRDLTILSDAFFSGSKTTENLLTQGDIRQALQLIKKTPQEVTDNQLNYYQRTVLQNLKNSTAEMLSMVRNSLKVTYENHLFSRDVHIWSSAIHKNLDLFTLTIKELYDRSGTESSSSSTV